MFENIREAFEGIRSHKLRSTLTMLGIIIGIASIIAISSTIMGTNERIKENLIGAGSNLVTVQLYQGEYPFSADYGQLPDGFVPAGADTLMKVRSVKGVTDAAFYVNHDAYSLVRHGLKTVSRGTVYGADNGFLKLHSYTLRAGRLFTEADAKNFRKVALIDRIVSETLFEGADPVGQTVEISGEPFTVIGEIASQSMAELNIDSLEDYMTYADSTGGKIVIPREVWPVVFRYDEPVSAAVKTAKTDDMTTAGKAAAAVLNETLPAGSDLTYKSDDLLEQARELQELSGSTNRQLILVAGISLLVGGIGVMNIMLVSVTERTPEIGLKKALGARRRKISAQFLIEAGVLTCLGGILGVLAGVGLAYVIFKVSGVPIFISGWIVTATVVFSFLIGICFGAVPAIQAAKLNPIDALRHE